MMEFIEVISTHDTDFKLNDVYEIYSNSHKLPITTMSGSSDITGIAAKSLSEAVYVAAVYSDGTTTWTSGVLGYSIGAYCSSQASKNVDVSALAMATAVYGYHAKQYFG